MSLATETDKISSLRNRPSREELDEELDTMIHESSLALGAPECQCQPCQNLLWEKQHDAHLRRISLATLSVRSHDHQPLYSISV